MKLEIISRYPAQETGSVPLLFVHGALHAAWCWDVHFLDYFAQRGFVAHAVNLRGHGRSEGRDRLRWTRIADFADDLGNAITQVGRPSILIGHSMGGFVIEKYLENHTAPGAVLLMTPPPTGMLGAAFRVARRHPLVFARINLTFSLYPLVSTPALAREAFFSKDVPDDQLLEYWKLMQDDSFLGFMDMVFLDLPRPPMSKIPVLVLGASRDNMLSVRDIKATAKAFDTEAEFIPDVAHNVMLEVRWETAAERILVWLTEGELRAVRP